MKLKTQNAKFKTGFQFLPNIATADLAFEATGRNYSELFENAGYALESAMVELNTLKTQEVKAVKIESSSLENLLSSFLEELIYLKDAKLLLFNSIVCDVKKRSKLWVVSCRLGGEKIDRKRHKLGVDVKAVTKHLFKIEKLSNKLLRCQVVLDV